MRRCCSLYSAWRCLGAVAEAQLCSMRPAASRDALQLISSSISSSSSSSSSSSPAWQFPVFSSASCGSNTSSIRWYAKHPQRVALRRANIAASRQAVAPFIQPDTAAAAAAEGGQQKAKAPVIDTALPTLPTVKDPEHFVRIGRITGPYIVEPQAAFAVVQLGAHQYKVTADDVMFVPKLKGVDIDDVLLLNKVLLTGTRQETAIGRPYLAGASVVATVEEHFKDAKVLVFKKKKRKRYSRLQGHRSHLTALRVLEVRLLGAGSDAVAKAAAAAAAGQDPNAHQQRQQQQQQASGKLEVRQLAAVEAATGAQQQVAEPAQQR